MLKCNKGSNDIIIVKNREEEGEHAGTMTLLASHKAKTKTYESYQSSTVFFTMLTVSQAFANFLQVSRYIPVPGAHKYNLKIIGFICHIIL